MREICGLRHGSMRIVHGPFTTKWCTRVASQREGALKTTASNQPRQGGPLQLTRLGG